MITGLNQFSVFFRVAVLHRYYLLYVQSEDLDPGLISAWTLVQSDQSSLCTQWLTKGRSFFMLTVKTDQNELMSRLIRVVGFLMSWLIFSNNNYSETCVKPV